MSSPSFQATFDAFLPTLNQRAPKTAETYRLGLEAFKTFAQARGYWELPVSSLPVTLLAEFYRWLAEHYDNQFTIKTYLAAANALLRHLTRQQLLPFSLEAAREAAREATKRTSYPTPPIPEGVDRLRTFYDDATAPPKESKQARLIRLRNRAIMCSLFSTAARLNEIARLTRRQVASGQTYKTIILGKGGKERVLFFNEEAQAAIVEYLVARDDNDDGLFVSHGRGKEAEGQRGGEAEEQGSRTGGVRKRQSRRLSARSIYDVVQAAAKALGIAGVHPHTIRHYRVSQWLAEKMPIDMVRRLAGHASISTTSDIYGRLADSVLEDAFFQHEGK